LTGLDGYTQTKAEAEEVLKRHIQEFELPAVIMRPGFIYGPGDRIVIPRLLKRFESGIVKFIGKGDKVLNNTSVHNFVDAIFLAMRNDEAIGEIINIRDERLVTREEYLMTVADYLGKRRPKKIPVWLAKMLVPLIEGFAKLRGKKESPLLTKATIKFMAVNLDFSIEKAKSLLGYKSKVDFKDGMIEALDWATGKNHESSSSVTS
jgi:nucleoside-diphosphate-sugar epimerase